MTSSRIVDRLAKEFSIQPDQVKSTFEMVDAGLAAPFIGRVRREQTGGLSEGLVRKLEHRRAELEELDRRRGTILRMLQGPAATQAAPATDGAPKLEPASGDSASATEAPGSSGDAPEAAEGGDADGARVENATGDAGGGTDAAGAQAPAHPTPDQEDTDQEDPEGTPTTGERGAERRSGAAVPRAVIERVEACMDRFELEDLFLPFRRPEPEVQLALDRGLGALADRLVVPLPPERRVRTAPAPAAHQVRADDASEPAGTAAPEEAANEAAGDAGTGDAGTEHASTGDASGEPSADAGEDQQSGDELAAQEAPQAEGASAQEPAAATAGEDEAPAAATEAGEAEAPRAEAEAAARGEAATAEGEEPSGGEAGDQARDGGEAQSGDAQAGRSGGRGRGKKKPARDPAAAAEDARQAKVLEALLHGQVELTPELARLCSEYVSPDRGIHTESDALAGAMRILSDRLGRDTRLRGQIRQLLRKQGILTVRPMVDEKRLGRHKALLRMKQPLRQVQGHRLLAIRQAQKERALSTVITLDRKQALPKVRNALGKHTDPAYAGALDAIALRTLEHRLLPLLEADVRLELKERADEEALRFLSQHLRQVLLTPPLGRRPVVGLDVNAKGDWTVAVLAEDGSVSGEVARIELAEKDEAALSAELAAALRPAAGTPPSALAVGHGKSGRAVLNRLRTLIAQAELDVVALPVNEAGLSSYASSELARRELTDLTVPQRMAVSLGRRLQDPLSEILKVDPRHLGLGSEQGLVSKANLRRTFDETVESCTAHVGCDVNQAPHSLLARLPGLDAAAAKRLIERRETRPFESREELRAEGLLTEAQWIGAVAFLRVPGSSEPLDATSLHPEQYALARRVVEAAGGSVEDSLGKPGITKGLRRADFGIEEHTWRDLMRELWHPGRDPRPRLFRPELLDPAADPITLNVGRVVDGIVANVASFGAFVYVGLDQDAMVHVSEISKRYVRDARELVSIGQTLRARIKEAGGQRLSLSLKDLPESPREGGGRRERRERGSGPRHGGGRERREREPVVPIRAAQSRRDGLAGARGRGGRGGPGGGRGGPGGGGGGGRGGRGGRPGDRGRRDEERVRPGELESVAGGAKGYNPFATFFKKGGDDEAPEPTEKPSEESSREQNAASGKETAPRE